MASWFITVGTSTIDVVTICIIIVTSKTGVIAIVKSIWNITVFSLAIYISARYSLGSI
jgi:hypothetical protein